MACLLAALGLPEGQAHAVTLDVTAFGAIAGDGLDDRAAIQSAIAAAGAGDTIFIPTGDFNISSAILPKSGITIAGAGIGSTVILPTAGMSGSMVRLQPVGMTPAPANVELTGFTLNGSSSTTVGQGIEATATSGLNIHDIRIQDLNGNVFGPHGIYFSGGVSDSVIKDSEFVNIGVGHNFGGGIRMEFGSDNNQVLNNTIDNTGRGGIFAKESSNLLIKGNTVTQSGGVGLGIELFGNSNFSVVEDNVIDHWLSLDSSSFVAVRRNTISDTSGVVKFIGLEMATGGSNNVFTDNMVNQGAAVGISLSNNGVKELSFFGHNTISGSTVWGAQLQADGGGIRQIYFFDNTFETANDGAGNEGNGFRINSNNAAGVTFLDLDSNRFINNEKFGIQFGGAGIDSLRIVDNTITGNGSHGFVDSFGVPGSFSGDNLLWQGNTVSGNGGSNSQPPSEGTFNGNQLPAVDILAPLFASVGQSIAFGFLFADDGTVGQVLWDFDEGVPVNSLTPFHTFSAPGVYRVTLVAWDDGGRAAIDQQFITITAAFTIPEPASAMLLGTGAVMLAGRRRTDPMRCVR